jgi:polyhydroxybutyrate depolymerase
MGLALLLAASTADSQRITRPIGRRGSTAQSYTQRITLAFQGRQRHYLLHVPAKSSGALLLAFHGGGETPENQEEISGFDALSDAQGFIVAYPEGIDKSWADGRGTTSADKLKIDDVGFARAIVANIGRTYKVDPKRVFATGPSNGGIFVSRLGCEASDVFAGIAPVIGTIATALAPNCRPTNSITVVGVQGIADPVVPFNGGNVGGSIEKAAAGGAVEGSRATQELWRSLNGCDPTVTSKTDRPASDRTVATTRTYSGCRQGVTVIWFEVAGGGHRWYPHQASGVAARVADSKLGKSAKAIDASSVIWGIFATHPRQ